MDILPEFWKVVMIIYSMFCAEEGGCKNGNAMKDQFQKIMGQKVDNL